MLSDFLVIGAAKSGTGSLHRYLRAHPDVFTPKLKEIKYFAWSAGEESLPSRSHIHFWARTLEEYEAYFAEARGERALGEVTPLYLTSSLALDRVLETIPDVKLVAIRRNPVDRAYSAYVMGVRGGSQKASVREAFSHKDASYIEAGRYARYLGRYYERSPSSQIKILRFDDLQRRPADVVSEPYRFLGVEENFRPDLEAHNKGFIPRSAIVHKLFRSQFVRRAAKRALPEKLVELGRRIRALNGRRPPGLPPDLRAELQAYYRKDISELESLTGMDFSGWRDDPAVPIGAPASDLQQPLKSR